MLFFEIIFLKLELVVMYENLKVEKIGNYVYKRGKFLLFV